MFPILQAYKNVKVKQNYFKFQVKDEFKWFRLALYFCTQIRCRYSYSTLSKKERLDTPLLSVEDNSNKADDLYIKWKQYHENLKKDFIYIIKKVNNLKVFVDPSIVSQLSSLFETEDVSHIVKYPKLKFCNKNQLSRTILFLHQQKINLTHLKMAPWLLWQTEDELKMKQKLLENLGLFENIVDGLGFLLFSPGVIKKYNVLFDSEGHLFPLHRNRIYYICNKLNISVDLFTIKLVSAWIILHLRKQKIDEVINILQEFGIEPKSITNDPWIFYQSPQKIKERLERVASLTAIRPKLWVCRSDPEVFERFCKYYDSVGLSNTTFENDVSMIFQNIAEILGCDLAKVERALKKDHQQESSILQIKRNLERLKEFGFTNKQIGRNLHVLKYDTDVIKRRLELLKPLNVEPKDVVSMSVFIKIKEFENFYQKRKLERDKTLNIQNKE